MKPKRKDGLNLQAHIWKPANVLRLATVFIVILVVIYALAIPMSDATRLKLITAMIAGLAYALLVWMPYLPGRKNLVDIFPLVISGTNAIFFGLVVYFFFALTPMVATLHFISIVGMAIRRGLGLALVNALLASLSYLTVFFALGVPAERANDSTVLIVTYFISALLIGSLGETLRRRTREFENVVNHSQEAILILNEHGHFEFANPAALTLGGYTLAELQRHSFFDLIIPADRAAARKVWQALRDGVESKQVSIVRVLTRSGATRTLAVTSATLDTRPTRYCIIARDITAAESERQAHERRHRELEAERTVTQAISQIFNLPELLNIALAQTLKAIQADAGAIYLANTAQTELTLAVAQNLPPNFAARVLTRQFGQGITGAAAAERRIITVPNLAQDPRVLDGTITKVMFAQVSVPLVYQERVVGVLNVNTHSEHIFDEEDLGLLRSIAASIAVAIDRARLFETLEQRIVARTTELSALNRITAVANQSLDLDAILNATLDELTRLLQIEGGWISQIQRAQGIMQMIAQRGVPAAILDDPIPLRLGEGVSGRVALEGRGYANNVEQFDLPTRDRLLNVGIQSVCAVPLAVQGQVIGVLGLLSRQKNRFGDADLRWLGAVGNTVAVAMQNAQLFESERRAREKAEALRQAAYAISGSLKLTDVLKLMLEQLKRVLTYDTASIFLLREADQPLLVSGIGYEDENTTSQIASNLLKPSSILSQMTRDLQPITIGDVRENPDWIWVPGAEHVRSFLGVPIISQGKMIGALMADSIHVNFFKEDDVQNATTLAQHITVALQNAQLFESVEQQLKQITTLREIDHTLNSLLDLEPMLEAVLDAVAHLVPYDCAAVLLLDGTVLRAVAGRGIDPTTLENYAIDISNNTHFWNMAQRHRPVFLHNVHTSPGWVTVAGMENVQSWLGAPLIARERVIGQLSLYSLTPNAFNDAPSDLLLSFADHTAIAIANAQLRAELHEQAQRDSLTQVLNHGTLIQEIRKAVEKAQQTNKPLALIMLDLDDFKQYNDTYGHVVGDEVLCSTVQAIRAHVKQTDLVGRWGGEEFSIALPNANQAQAMLVAERIRKTLASTRLQTRDGTPIPPPTISQGIAVLGQTAHSLDELIDQADRALYRAKARGKDQVAVAQ